MHSSRIMALAALLLALVLSAGLTACPSQEPVETTNVAIRNNRYEPPLVKVKLGQIVTFKNEDSVEHTVTADDYTTPNQPIPPGGEIGFTPGEELEMAYHCAIHRFKGKLIAVK